MQSFRQSVLPIYLDELWTNVQATAFYRLLPTIDILSPITGSDAEKFVNCFPKGVARVVTNKKGVKHAEVVNPRLDTVSREVLRHDEFKDKVKLGRVRDHFICKHHKPFFACTRADWQSLLRVREYYRLISCSCRLCRYYEGSARG
jgi:hypothetical protein